MSRDTIINEAIEKKECSREHGIECWHGNYCRECGEKFHSNEEEG